MITDIETFKKVFIQCCEELHFNKAVKYESNESENKAIELLVNYINNSQVTSDKYFDFIKYVITGRYSANRRSLWDNQTYNATNFVKSFKYFELCYLYPDMDKEERNTIVDQWKLENKAIIKSIGVKEKVDRVKELETIVNILVSDIALLKAKVNALENR